MFTLCLTLFGLMVIVGLIGYYVLQELEVPQELTDEYQQKAHTLEFPNLFPWPIHHNL
jgi:hypothetical protein